MNEKSLAEKKTDLFFMYRFPEKDTEFEKRVGYYQTWLKRMNTPNPRIYMDLDSLKAYEKVLQKLYEDK